VQKADPSVPKDEIVSDWEDYYKPLGARETAPGFIDSMGRGAETAVKQIPQLLHGVEAGVGAVGENVFGSGGLSTALKNHGVAGFNRISEDLQKKSELSDSLTHSYDQATKGDFGELVNWLGYGLGYTGVQAVEMLATAGVGSLVGQYALKTAATTVASKMVAKEAAKIATTSTAATLTAEEIGKLATKNVAMKIGQNVALAATAAGMEGGEIYGDLVSDAQREGRAVKGDELAKAFVATLGAGALEFVGDRIGLDLIVGKSPIGKMVGGAKGLLGKVGRGTVAGVVAAIPEGATEYGQTLIEEAGKGKDPFSSQALTQAFDAAGLGAVGGWAAGQIGGFTTPPTAGLTAPIDLTKKAGGTPPPETEQLQPLTSRPEKTVSATPEDVANIEDVLKPDLGIDEAIKTADEVVDAPVLRSKPLDLFIDTQIETAEAKVEEAKTALEEPVSTAIPPAILPAAVTATPLPDMTPDVATVESVTKLVDTKRLPQAELSTMIQMETGKISLEDLSPAELQKLQGQLETVLPSEPVPPFEPPSQPVSPELGKPPVSEPSTLEPATTQAGSETAITKPEETVYQGRGNTPEEIYGKEAVDAGRAVPIFGKGQYYATTSKDAAQYGKVTAHPRPKLANPFVLDSDKKWRSLIIDAQVPHLDNMNEFFYKESQKIPAATEKLQDYLRRKGYDGIIVKLAKGSDETRRLRAMVAHDQIVVFAKPAASKTSVAPHLVPPQTERYKTLKAESRTSFETALKGALSPDEDERRIELLEVLSRLESPTSPWYGEFVARTGLTLEKNPMKLRKQVTDYFNGLRESFGKKTAAPAPPVVEKPVKGSVETLIKTEKKPAAVETKPVTTETKPVTTETKPVTTDTKPVTTETGPAPVVNRAAIPKGTMIELRGIRAATGDEITMPEDAVTALTELDASLIRYRQLLECVSA
jgi:hypothetical protein